MVVVKSYKEMGAVIAGGTAGIGLACAEGLLRAGVPRLVVVGRDPERGRAAVQRLGVSDAHDQAALVVFLAGPSAARLTGQAISVNGRISAA